MQRVWIVPHRGSNPDALTRSGAGSPKARLVASQPNPRGACAIVRLFFWGQSFFSYFDDLQVATALRSLHLCSGLPHSHWHRRPLSVCG